MKKIFLLLLAIFIAFSINVSAQKLSLSPLSFYGIGEINFQGNSRQLAMGHTAIADFNNFHVSKINPANLGSLKPNQVVFEIGLFDKISVFSTADEEQTNNLSDIRYMYGAFRITKWWHISFGVSPFSSNGYKIVSHDSIANGESYSPFDIVNEGGGNLNQVFWGNSFTFLKNFSLGANINYNFGSFDRNQNVVMRNEDTSFVSISLIKDRNIFHKINYDFGFTYNDTIKSKNKEFMRFSIGATYSNKTTINTIETKYASRQISYLGHNFSDSLFYDTVGTSKIMMPQTLGFGISMTFYNKYTFSADYITRKWSESEIFGQKNFNNSSFIGLGMEYCESPFSSRFLRTIRYRIGAYKNQSYISFNGQQVNTQALTFGLGIPLKSLMLNLNFAYGQTGNINLGLREDFYEFNFGISLYDLWFIKRKFM